MKTIEQVAAQVAEQDAQSQLSEDDARRLTDEVKADAEALWAKLLALYDGGAHAALGYSSWGEYYTEEFGGSKTRGYELLNAARVTETLRQSAIADSGIRESVARELAPLQDAPEAMAAALTEAREKYGPDPTAAQVRDVVRETPRLGVHYTSTSDEWSTPQDLYDFLDREFGFELDVCATALNAKCDRFFDRAQDGLSQPWEGVCWMNPPYGDRIVEWVAKAKHSAEEGAIVVCLVPARTDTAWFWDYCRWGEVRFLRGRLKFGGEASAPFPSCVVVFDGTTEGVKWWDWKS